MLDSIRKHHKGTLLTLAVVVLLVGASWAWDWHQSLWDWLGETNRGETNRGEATSGDTTDGETNSATLRNFALLPLAIIGIWLTLWRIMVAERTLAYSEDRDRADRVHSRYAEASGRLSGESVSVRMGAIYELQDLTDQDPEQLHVRTMKLLCAFVRFPPADARLDAVPEDDPCSVALRQDVQAAMEVIGSRTLERIRLEADADYLLDLRLANLVRLQLCEGNLSRIDMQGSKFWGADLADADLSDCVLQYTDFSSPWVIQGEEPPEIQDGAGSFYQQAVATLDGQTHLTRANLSRARMFAAKMTGTVLQGADLSNGVLIDVNLTRAVTREADFTDANLTNADLSGANLIEADFNTADLSGADLGRSSPYAPPGERRAIGLTQQQLDQACAEPGNPPILDPDSDLVWNPKPCPK